MTDEGAPVHADEAPGLTLVTGATGDIGGQVLRRLVADGVAVRAVHRRPEQAGELAALGAQPVQASFGDRASLEVAMAGCERLFLLSPPVPGQADLDIQAVEAARAQQVRRIVRVSAADSSLRTRVPWAQAHAVADHHLMGSGSDWTVLRPVAFMQNFLQQASTIRRGWLPQTSGSGQVSWVDTADVAEVAARVLQDSGHTGATYFLTGPEPLSVPQVAERFGAALGRRVRYVHLPGATYTAVLRLSGQDAFTARGLRAQFGQVIRSHLDVDTTGEVERLTGRPATTFQDWVDRHLDRFR